MTAPGIDVKHPGVPSFKPETSAYYPMSHAMSHMHKSCCGSKCSTQKNEDSQGVMVINVSEESAKIDEVEGAKIEEIE